CRYGHDLRIAPPSAASHLRSGIRGSSRVIPPRADASNLSSEFLVSVISGNGARGRSDSRVPVMLPPYALSAPVFKFRHLATLAGRAPIGGAREVALACFVAARLASDCRDPALDLDE